MGLFKSAEQKAQEQYEKEQKVLKKYGMETLISDETYNSVVEIIRGLAGTGLLEVGNLLNQSAEGNTKLTAIYTRVIMEQNFVLIRQLDRIGALLEHK